MQHHWSDENHLVDQVSPHPSGQGELLVVRMGACRHPPDTPFQEAIIAAKKISARAQGRPVSICLSGGIDSACMAEAFQAAGVPFVVRIFRFNGDWNWPDICDAVSLCQKNGWSWRFIDIDVLEFLSSKRYLELCREFRCRSPQIAVHIECLTKIADENCIMGGNPPRFVFEENRFDILIPSEPQLALLRYFRQSNLPGVPFFFSYTPELALSFCRLPSAAPHLDRIRKILKGETVLLRRPSRPKERQAIEYAVKCLAYREGGFQCPPRIDKLTGFEVLRRHDDQFNLKYRTPLETEMPYPRDQLHLFRLEDLGLGPTTAE